MISNYQEHINQIIKSIREVVSDMIEDSKQNLMNVAWIISEARRILEKAKRELEKLEKE